MTRTSWSKVLFVLVLAGSSLLISLVTGAYKRDTTRRVEAASKTLQDEAARNSQRHSVTVADAIGMTRLADPYYNAGGSSKGIVATFSPDGTHFAVVLRKGDLEQNANVYSLFFFQTSDIFNSPAPRILVSLASTSNRPAITDVTWLADNETILFLGEHPGEHTQLYSINCRSGDIKQLTNQPTSLTSFVTAGKGDQIVYVAEDRPSSFDSSTPHRSGIEVSGEDVVDLIRDYKRYPDYKLFAKELGTQDDKEVHTIGAIRSPSVKMTISPNGQYFVVQTEATHIPAIWSQYDDKFLRLMTLPNALESSTGVEQYELGNTQTGTSQVLLDAPVAPNFGGSEAIWSSDSHSVVVSHVYLPLQIEDPAEQSARKLRPWLVAIDVPSRQYTKLSEKDLRLIRWDDRTDYLVCDVGRIASFTDQPTAKAYFRKIGGKWFEVATSEDMPPPSRPEIVLDENLGTPPRILAVDPASGRKSLLMDLNSQFSGLTFARVEKIQWKDTLGDEVDGGLYWPPDFAPGKRYPLIIQTHGFRPERFWIDGPYTSAFAAQPLAGKGFFVLQVPDPDWHVWDTPEEAVRAAAAYEGAVDYLDHKGLIDRNRVGLIGFSRTCFYVTYALTHSTYTFAAASITDGIDGGYFQYMAFAGASNEFDALNGAPPFGGGLSLWMKRSPPFLMNKVRAPLMIQAIGPGSLLSEWDWYSGLSRLDKPVDMIYIPNGSHILERPWDRLTSQEGNVDWFCFWLKGEEDPDPAKAEEYKHWRKLRTDDEELMPRTRTQ